MDEGVLGWIAVIVVAASWLYTAQADRQRRNLEQDAARREAEALRARIDQLAPDASRAQDLAERLAQSQAQLERLGIELRDGDVRIARAQAECEAARVAHEETKQFLQDAQVKLRAAFLEVASKVFDEKAIALDQRIKDSGEASKQGMEGTLKPFTEQLGQFRARIEQFTSEQGKDHARLVGSLNELRTLNQGMAEATTSLARALKGNAKTRGDWGEMILETVLKASGLVEGSNYLRQDSNRDDESGRLRKPDVIVMLPDGRKVIVDSKVNLVAWSEANEAESAEDYNDAMLRHTAAMRAHVRDLHEKNYPRVLGASSLDLTVMFVPIEGAMSAALSLNPDLQTDAFNKRVVFASPNTLMALLTVVERLWTRDKLQRQVGAIGEDAGKVLDAITSFLDDFDMLEKRMQAATAAFGTAKNRLRDSDQSVLARAKRLVEQGARGKKVLREELLPADPSTALPLLLDDTLDATEDLKEDGAE
jgi:DNA recombination protein RmuC